MTDTLQRHLEAMFGLGAAFRDGQREAIEAAIRPGSRSLVVQRTGWGKSLVYWIATRVRRDQGHGPTLIVSPLLALMRNQIAMAERLRLRAVTINSANRDSWPEVEAALLADEIDVLFVSAPRFANPDFMGRVLPSITRSIGMFVVDEAHCISDWGHDFVPDYRRISRLLPLLGPTVPVLGTTATANDRVVRDVATQLGQDVTVIRGPLGRASLHLDAIPLADQAERLAWLVQHLPAMRGSGIVYCLTVADTKRVAACLQAHGIDARPYHGELTQEERIELEDQLLANECKALVSTIALGMGFDKPDLGFVVHFQRPGSPIAYYQQVGRAGRGVADAFGVLLYGREDDDIADYFIRTAFPPTARMQEILTALESEDRMTIRQVEDVVNLSHGQIEKSLKLLEVDGAVAHERGFYFRTPNPWTQDKERIDGVIAARRAELASMQEYVATDECRMAFLGRLLDDPAAEPCGHCANCGGRRWPREVDHGLVVDALRCIRSGPLVIEPRKMAAHGAKLRHLNEEGRALCRWGDPGWGVMVRSGKYETGRLADELVEASADLILRRWGPSPAPVWVAAVPSGLVAGLIGDFAARLAVRLGLPFVDSLTVLPGAQSQKHMQNSRQQEDNARRKLGVLAGEVRRGPVLLVDDIVDSRWTLTVAGELLRDHGSGPVFPFALAEASPRLAS